MASLGYNFHAKISITVNPNLNSQPPTADEIQADIVAGIAADPNIVSDQIVTVTVTEET